MSTESGSSAADRGACEGHAGMAGEVRQLAATAVDRLQPWLDRFGQPDEEDVAERTPASCRVCPVCAVIAVLRGERPELARRLAEQASGLLLVLRSALEEGDPAAAGSADRVDPRPRGTGSDRATVDDAAPVGRTVQRIRVHRVDQDPT